jgi:hypothetical protein
LSEFDRALAQINALRSQVAKATEFHGYGPMTFAVTGAVAGLAGLAQGRWLSAPAQHTTAWLALWVGVAAASAAIIGVEMVGRSRRLHVHLAHDMIRAAVEQFLPCAVAGGALTAVLATATPQSLWMLPGLWQMLFGLGVFASCRFLPRPMLLVGGWYLATGLVCLAAGGGAQAFAPWTMAAPFGVGQILVAAILRLNAGGSDD